MASISGIKSKFHIPKHLDGEKCSCKSCGHCEDNENIEESSKSVIIRLAVSVILLLITVIFKLPTTLDIILCVIAFIISGYEIIWETIRKIAKLRFIDEEFLMTIAGIAAFIIGAYTEAVILIVLYQLGEFLVDKAVGNSRRAINHLAALKPDTVKIEKDGSLVEIKAEDVEVGEIITVLPGERVGLDGIIVSGNTDADTSAITGESVPRSLGPGAEILSGFMNLTGAVTVKVTSPLAQSTVSRILELVESASSKKSNSETFITRFAHYYTPIVIAIAILVAVIPSIFGGSFSTWVYRSLIFLVISCPCALIISVPLSYFAAIGGATRCGILFKGSGYLEQLASLKTVVFDKTGTLTSGTFKVTSIEPAHGLSKDSLLMLTAFAEACSTHPLAVAVVEAYGKKIDRTAITNHETISGLGVITHVNGVIVTAGNAAMMQKLGISVPSSENDETVIHVAVNDAYAGKITLSDTLKPDSLKAVKRLKELGINRIVMLSGDRRSVSDKASRELDISEYYCECLPQDKADKLEKLLSELNAGSTLAYVGDGINDAPVLALADVGVSMGGLGSDSAIEASDMVIMNDEPSKLADAVVIARKTKNIVLQNVIFSLGTKFVIMILGIIGIAPLWLAVFADTGVALLASANATRAYNILKGNK